MFRKNGRLVRFAIFFILAIYIALIYINYDTNKHTIENLSQNNQINMVKLYKQRLDEWLGLKIKIIASTAKILKELDPQSDYEPIRKNMQNAANIGEFLSVSLGYEDDMYIISSDEFVPKDYRATQREWYIKAVQNDSVIVTKPYDDAFIDMRLLAVASAFKSTKTGVQAVLSGDIKFNEIHTEIANINESLQGFAFLMTKEGEIIVAPNASSDKICKECTPAVDAITKNDSAQNLLRYKANGKNFILFYEPLQNSEWIFAMTLDENEILSPLRRNFMQNIVLAVILALLGVAAFYFLNILRERVKTNEQIMLSHSKIAAMGEMLVAATHQLKQPVSAMLIILGALKMKLQDRDSKLNFAQKFDEMSEIIKFMQKTLESFKNFYSSDNVKISVNLVDVLDEVLAIMTPITQINNIDLTLSYEKGDYETTLYPNYLKQIVINLISNSKDAICEKRGTGGGYIKITLLNEGENFEIIVEDDGVGIRDDFLDRLFREMQTTKGEKGSGNGLYICKLLAQNKLNGHIELVRAKEPTAFKLSFKKGGSDE